MGVQHKLTITAAVLLLGYKSYILVRKTIFLWHFLKLIIESEMINNGYFSILEYIFLACQTITEIAVGIEVVTNLIMVVTLFKKNADTLITTLKLSATCFAIQFITFIFYRVYIAVEFGIISYDLKATLYLLLSLGLELTCCVILLMIGKYYLKMKRYESSLVDEVNTEQRKGNAELAKHEFKVLI